MLVEVGGVGADDGAGGAVLDVDDAQEARAAFAAVLVVREDLVADGAVLAHVGAAGGSLVEDVTGEHEAHVRAAREERVPQLLAVVRAVGVLRDSVEVRRPVLVVPLA